jgi:hypothetical protein
MPLMLLNPRRPTKEFMRRCLAGIGPGAADPGAVCASTWQKLSAAGKRKWLARENPAGLEARFGLRAIYIKGGRSHEATEPFHGRTFATLPELNRWAQALGFKWIERRSYIFGGYYNKPDGTSLLPDIFFPKLARENPRFATLIRGPGGEPEAARRVGRAVKVGRETFYLSRASGDPESPWTVTDPVSGHGVAAGKSAKEALDSLKKRVKDHGGPAGFIRTVNEARKEIMARLSRPNPGAVWHGREAGVASEEQEVARLKGQPAREEYFAGMEQAHMESAAESERLSGLAAFKRRPERYYPASPPEKPWTPRRRYNPVEYDLDELLPEKAAAFAKALKHYYLARKISRRDYEALAGRLDRMGQTRREPRFMRAAAFLRGQSFHPSAVKWNPVTCPYMDAWGVYVQERVPNPSRVEGARLKRLSGGPEKSYRGFHGAPVDSAREVKVPADWPKKLWMLGRMDEMRVSLDPQREGGLGMKLHGGTVAVGPRNGRLYIFGAMPPLKAGTVGLVKEISYTPPKRSGKAFGGSYVHAFDRPPRLTGRGGRFLEVSGQGLKLTRRGIVG